MWRCRRAYDEIAAQQRTTAGHARVDYRAIAKNHRGLAGALGHLVLAKAERPLSAEEVTLMAAIRGRLGAQAGHVESAVHHGAGRGILVVLGWYDPSRLEHRRALDAALRQAKAPAATVSAGRQGVGKEGR